MGGFADCRMEEDEPAFTTADYVALNASGYLIQPGIKELRDARSGVGDVRTLQTEIIAALINRYGFVNRIPRNVLHNADYIVKAVFPGADDLDSFLPVIYKRLAEPVSGEEPKGPIESQFELLSDRVAHIHAFVLSAR